MKKILLLFNAIFLFANGGQEFVSLGDFTCDNGEIISDCQIGFRRFGSANSDSSNIVVVPTWFSGKSGHVAGLVGTHTLYDSSAFQIIVIDALGNGISSSPSNSAKQGKLDFPAISINDMVRSQFSLLHDALGFPHIYAVVGGSMGGMQTFQWLISYPDFMTKAISYVGVPYPSLYSQLIWDTESTIITQGLNEGRNISEIADQIAKIELLMAHTPDYRNQQAEKEEYDIYVGNYLHRFMQNFDPFNWLCQLKSMRNHNIYETVADSNAIESILSKTDLFIIVSKQDHLVSPEPAIEFADLYNIPIFIFDNNCGHLAPGCEKDTFFRIVNQFLAGE